MAIINYTLWTDDGVQLRDFKYPKRYLTPENYVAANPLENLVAPPGLDVSGFFGTKVLNIFIVAQPYGWNLNGSSTYDASWPPVGYLEAKARHIASFDYYTFYETYVYMDYNIVAKVMSSNPSSDFRSMMDSTKTNMIQMCTDLAAYGFKMEGDITADADASYFQPLIDSFNIRSF